MRLLLSWGQFPRASAQIAGKGIGVMDPTKQSHLKRGRFGSDGEAIVNEMGKTSDTLGNLGVAALQKGVNTIFVSTSTVTTDGEASEKKIL